MPLRKSIAVLIFSLLSVPLALGQTVTVQPGDTLSGIAKRELGSARRWQELCKLNHKVVKDCDLVVVGTKLHLPAEAAPAAKSAPPKAAPAKPAPAEVAPTETTPAEEPAAKPEEAPAPAAVAPPEQQASEPPAAAETPKPSEPAAETVERVNLIEFPSDYMSDYWSGYFVKPAITAGQPDPTGGSDASRFASADAAESPQGAFSGLIHPQKVPPGTYTIGAWLRSTSGPLTVRIGLSDAYLAPRQAIGEDWQYVQYTVTAETEVKRLFEVFEATKGNPDWELFGVSVEKGKFTTPFYPAPE